MTLGPCTGVREIIPISTPGQWSSGIASTLSNAVSEGLLRAIRGRCNLSDHRVRRFRMQQSACHDATSAMCQFATLAETSAVAAGAVIGIVAGPTGIAAGTVVQAAVEFTLADYTPTHPPGRACWGRSYEPEPQTVSRGPRSNRLIQRNPACANCTPARNRSGYSTDGLTFFHVQTL